MGTRKIPSFNTLSLQSRFVYKKNFHLSVQSNSESLLLGFTLLHLAIGTENSYYFLNRSDPKLKQRRNSYSYFPALKTVFMTPDRNTI